MYTNPNVEVGVTDSIYSMENGETYFMFYTEPAWFVCVTSRFSSYDDAVKSKKCFLKKEDHPSDNVTNTNDEEGEKEGGYQDENWEYSVLRHNGLVWVKDKFIRTESGTKKDYF